MKKYIFEFDLSISIQDVLDADTQQNQENISEDTEDIITSEKSEEKIK